MTTELNGQFLNKKSPLLERAVRGFMQLNYLLLLYRLY